MSERTPGRRFEEALVYAMHIHAAQVRKGTSTPYVSHLLGTASIALEHGADEDAAIAALLHDAAEDQGGRARLDDIRARFGEHVAMIVDACTDSYEDPKPDWRARKEAYVGRIAAEHPEARLVSASDKLHNARAILCDYRQLGEALWARFNSGKDDILWYYDALVRAFREAGDHRALIDELAATVGELHAFAAR